MSKISVFGDSFASFDITTGLEYKHWLGQLKAHQGYDNSNLLLTAAGGSGPMDHIYQFFQHIPDVENSNLLIFVWSQSSRLFHEKIRDINVGSAMNPLARQYVPSTAEEDRIYDIALEYYKEFYHEKTEEIKMAGLLQWFDRILLELCPDKKIFHFQSFTTCRENDEEKLNDQTLYHNFKSGINVAPPLMYLSENEPNYTGLGIKDKRPGHLNQDNHNLVFEKLKAGWDKNKGDIILLNDNYKPSYTLDFYSDNWKDVWR